MRSTVILLALTLTLSGCIQTIAIRTVGGIMENGLAAFNEESDLDIAREGLSGNLKLLEALIKGDPENESLLLFASQGYSAYALAFVEDDSVERARPLYLRAREYAFRVLDQKMDLRAALAGDLDGLRSAVDRLSDDDVPAVFWAAFSWGAFINISRTDLSAMGDLSKVDVLMEFVVQRRPSYYYGGADAYFGSVKGTVPAVLGGRPDQSKVHFERAMAVTNGRFLMVPLMYAKTYCVQVQDRELFEKLLIGVLDASLEEMPEARLPNAMAKKKAARLLQNIDELF